MAKFSVLALLLCVNILGVKSAKILAVFSYPSKSHHVLGSALLKVLAERGHEVTMLSPYPFKTPVKNYEDIPLTGIMDYLNNQNTSQGMASMQEFSLFQRVERMRTKIQKMDKMFLNDKALQQLLNSNRTYDLVIQNWFFNWASLGIANHFKAPVIAFSTFGSTILVNQITGNTNPYAYVPNIFLSFPGEMTFMQRVGNTLGTLAFELLEYLDYQMHENNLREHFPNAPSLEQLLKNVSLVLINSHFSIESPRPYVPSMIQIGGFHVDEPKELKGDLKEFMENSEGILFFSFGSNIKTSALPKDKIESIIASFAKLPLKVLWKFEDELPNLPSNVRTGKWFPQRDILAHRNTKVFVTHGGLLSTTEAVYHGVPVVGIPFFADQEYNIADSVCKGYAVQIGYKDLSEETLTSAVMEILNNSRYHENIKLRSAALKDQPLKPMDKAIFWIEYVLRHKGASILKSDALKLSWYQYFLLDVFVFLVGIALIAVIGICAAVIFLLKLMKLLFGKLQVSKDSRKEKVA